MGKIEAPKFRNVVDIKKSPSIMNVPHPHFNQQTSNDFAFDEEEFNVETLSVNSSAIE
jgi:hypothetical protein